jgi:long-subunit acyl-CoA synthetase (AMP-forming)
MSPAPRRDRGVGVAELDVQSLCAAFQGTVAKNPDAVALRTPGGAVEITWSGYAGRVGRITAGLAALGVDRGDTVGLMMANRPEFHVCDTGAMHLGATRRSRCTTRCPRTRCGTCWATPATGW